MRLNARLDQKLDQKFAYIREHTGKNSSEIIRSAIEMYYEHLKKSQSSAWDVFQKAGFIAVAEAEPELSGQYKDILKTSLQQKYDSR